MALAAAGGGALGAISVVVGVGVLAGVADPGYVVLHPLVAYNALAGLLGVIAAWQIWQRRSSGARLAIWLVGLHASVLLVLMIRRALDAPVATESLTAMAFRTALWAIVLIAARRSLSERSGRPWSRKRSSSG